MLTRESATGRDGVRVGGHEEARKNDHQAAHYFLARRDRALFFAPAALSCSASRRLVEDELLGILRATTSTPARRSHYRQRVSFGRTENQDYESNIQIADLNALNAAVAVVRWKKLVGFYADNGGEHHTTYTIDSNMLLGDDFVDSD